MSLTLSSRTCFGIFVLILSKNEEPGRAASERRTALYRGGSTIWGRTVFHAYSGSSFFSAQRILDRDAETSSWRILRFSERSSSSYICSQTSDLFIDFFDPIQGRLFTAISGSLILRVRRLSRNSLLSTFEFSFSRLLHHSVTNYQFL